MINLESDKITALDQMIAWPSLLWDILKNYTKLSNLFKTGFDLMIIVDGDKWPINFHFLSDLIQ